MPLYTSPALLAPIGPGMAMAPTIVGSSTSFFSSSGLTSYTVPHTVPAGANCLALYLGSCNNWLDFFTSVTWNGVELAQQIHAFSLHSSVGPCSAAVLALANPDTGAHDIVIETATPDSLACYAVNLAGVDTAALAAATLEQELVGSGAVPLSVYGGSLSSPASPSLIFGGIVLPRPAGPASFTPAAGVTELADGTASGANASRHFAGYRREIAGTHNFGATCTQTGYGALAAVAFKGS